MPIQTRRKVLAGALGLLAITAARAQGAAPALVLSNDSIGPLKLHKGTKLELSQLQNMFAPLLVERKLGEQDGPDFVYFQISDEKQELFWIKAMEDDPSTIQNVRVTSPKVADQFGIRVGTPYSQVAAVRRGLRVDTDEHEHTTAWNPHENLLYELDVSAAGRKPTRKEIAHSKVMELAWVPL